MDEGVQAACPVMLWRFSPGILLIVISVSFYFYFGGSPPLFLFLPTAKYVNGSFCKAHAQQNAAPGRGCPEPCARCECGLWGAPRGRAPAKLLVRGSNLSPRRTTEVEEKVAAGLCAKPAPRTGALQGIFKKAAFSSWF